MCLILCNNATPICNNATPAEASQGCRTYVGSRGHLDSPFFPTSYPSNIQVCLGRILGPPQSSIRLRFYDMDIEYAEDCQYDYIEVGQWLCSIIKAAQRAIKTTISVDKCWFHLQFCKAHPNYILNENNPLATQNHDADFKYCPSYLWFDIWDFAAGPL